MAKDQEKKRKLERESLGHAVSTKRARKNEAMSPPNESSVNESKTSTASASVSAYSQSTSAGERSQEKQHHKVTDKKVSTTENRSGKRSSELPAEKNKNAAQIILSLPKDKSATSKQSDGQHPGASDLTAVLDPNNIISASHAVVGLRPGRSEPNGAQEDDTGDLRTTVTRDSLKQNGWYISPRSGGAYIDQDPVFVRDEHGESCIISATQYEVLLLSLETSQVIRSHTVPKGRAVACFCLSAADRNLLQVAYDNGEIVRWNWTTSAIIRTDLKTEGRTIFMLDVRSSGKKAETFLIVQRAENFSILCGGQLLYKTKTRPMALQVLRGAKYIIALTSSTLVVGIKSETKPASSGMDADSSYAWVQIPSSKYAFTCFDAHITEELATSKKAKTHPTKLAVAVGNEHGQIHLYSDVLSLFSTNAELPTPRVLHWHPELVSTVRFTESGYYLLSGGKETVLVFWQLDTGKRSYLPHLPAEIERLVLSPDGTHYALLLGDNSILVLNSTEQKAIAIFSGLQLPPIATGKHSPVLPKITAVLHRQNAHHLLLTVPATSPKRPTDITARPFLQTFDTRNCRHLSRQALARNTITDFNTGPDMRPIIPPDVYLIAVSQDGRWLATLDEWIPQAFDLKHLVPQSTALSQIEMDEVLEQQHKRGEVFLKFWRWQDREQTWALNTRIESPHGSAVDNHMITGPGQVFKLIADPTSNGFITVGEDGHVKVWRPKVRTRHGVPLKSGRREELVEWVCRRNAPLPTSKSGYDPADSPMNFLVTPEKVLSAEDATLAISEDGSTIACALLPGSPDDHPVVHFMSATTGVITASRTYLAASGSSLVAMAFLKRYFITLSAKAVRVWDLIEDEPEYTVDLPDVESHTDEPMLAVDPESETFAVLSRASSGQSHTTRRVRIYNPQHRDCLLDTTFSNTALAILSGERGRRYTVLFDDSTIRTISQNNSAARLIATDLNSPRPNIPLFDSSTEDANVASGETASLLEDAEMVDGVLTSPDEEFAPSDYVEDDRPVVRPEQLASVFDVEHSSSLPPVKDMFHAVVGLFARKPRLEGSDGDAMEVDG